MVDMKIFERRNNLEDPLKTEDKKISPKKSKPLPNISSLFSEKEVSAFVKKLFQNDRAQFNSFVNKLEPLSDWKVAFKTVEEEFQHRKINLRQNEAQLFTDKLFKRYYPD